MAQPVVNTTHSLPQQAVDAVRDYLTRLRSGSSSITVQGGRIVQLDVTEERRLAR